VKAAKKVGADFVEFNTGKYATACELGSLQEVDREISAIEDMTMLARKYGLRVLAGHGLNYRNVASIAAIEGIEEVNIGHSIVARSVFVGMEKAVKEMLDLLRG
jgi:pyridoxine 5-phosphate synthase